MTLNPVFHSGYDRAGGIGAKGLGWGTAHVFLRNDQEYYSGGAAAVSRGRATALAPRKPGLAEMLQERRHGIRARFDEASERRRCSGRAVAEQHRALFAAAFKLETAPEGVVAQ